MFESNGLALLKYAIGSHEYRYWWFNGILVGYREFADILTTGGMVTHPRQ
jgi:hypothetical protein